MTVPGLNGKGYDMNIIVFGSLNIDRVYRTEHLVREGETISSLSFSQNPGGKGINQAVALSRAGQKVIFAGACGRDGELLQQFLEKEQVDTRFLRVLDTPTGHAVIQVDQQGRNCILLYGGANQEVTPDMIARTLEQCPQGSLLLMQNEISNGEFLIRYAIARGLHVVLNPSPVTEEMKRWPLDLVDLFVLNETEGLGLTGASDPEKILDLMMLKYPRTRVLLTLGEKGAVYTDGMQRVHQPIFRVSAVDTTAAGDTFTGYFLAEALRGANVRDAMRVAARAAAIAVTRPGAAESIPKREELTGSFPE